MTATIRMSAAGSFYPADPAVLRDTVSALLCSQIPEVPPGVLKALIVPHAGYVYSGRTAAAGFALLREALAEKPKILLIGPAHRYPLRGIAVPEASFFETPLGRVEVAEEVRHLSAAGLEISDDPFIGEHCLEVELPFLQMALPKIELMPVLVGDAGAEMLAQVMEKAAADFKAFIIVSSDLSHYLTDEEARQVDFQTSSRIEKLEYNDLRFGDACGVRAIKALLRAAARKGWECEVLRLSNSSEASGDTNRVVGYGAYAVFEPGFQRQ